GPDAKPLGAPARANLLDDLGEDPGAEGGRVDREGGAKALEIEGMGRARSLQPVERLLPDLWLLPRALPEEPYGILQNSELKGLLAPRPPTTPPHPARTMPRITAKY